ncbi:glycosyltransferase [Chryseolinea sp. T2]|uniref:glycosyltransferase family 2 protein n=1 Tax=Chryseolinea sp. T2 TaxID=3129255 RepID=UPI0030772568
MAKPLVTVICLCYNHGRFVREAIESVLRQTYPAIQILVWDDASTDNSPAVIRELQDEYPRLEVTLATENEGNCKAFNQAYARAKGEFIIDFSTDDVMQEQSIEKQVNCFLATDDNTGVVFTDATYIDEQGVVIRHHYEHLFRHRLITDVATGDVFRKLLTTYYIASPTMMMRRTVLDALNGYDEQLSYEDFDLWVRSSRIFRYTFLNERLYFIRLINHSLSSGQYAPASRHLISTYRVCQKAIALCRDSGDRGALVQRIRYELRQSTLSDNAIAAKKFGQLLYALRSKSLVDRGWLLLSAFRLPLSRIRKWYQVIRFGSR